MENHASDDSKNNQKNEDNSKKVADDSSEQLKTSSGDSILSSQTPGVYNQKLDLNFCLALQPKSDHSIKNETNYKRLAVPRDFFFLCPEKKNCTIGKDGGKLVVGGIEFVVPVDAVSKNTKFEFVVSYENGDRLKPIIQYSSQGPPLKKEVEVHATGSPFNNVKNYVSGRQPYGSPDQQSNLEKEAMQPVSHTNKRVLSKTTVGDSGGTIELAGCKVVIPPDALATDTDIELCVHWEENDQENKNQSSMTRPTPLLEWKPFGLKFSKNAQIILPITKKVDPKNLRVEMVNLETWELELKEISYKGSKQPTVSFCTSQFTKFEIVCLSDEETSQCPKKQKKKVQPKDILLLINRWYQDYVQSSEKRDSQFTSRLLVKVFGKKGLDKIMSVFAEDKKNDGPKVIKDAVIEHIMDNGKSMIDEHGSIAPMYNFHENNSKSIGKSGGAIEVGGCKITIPPGALKEETKIEADMYYGLKSKERQLVPLILCKPHKIKFSKEVEISLPTCYKTAGVFVEVVKISEDFSDISAVKSMVMKRGMDCVTFPTTEFSLYYCLVRPLHVLFGLLKEMSFIFAVPTGTGEVPPNIVASILICDNSPSAKRLDNLTALIETSFEVGCKDENLIIKLTSRDVRVEQQECHVNGVWCKARDETMIELKSQEGQDLADKKITVEIKSASTGRTLETKDVFLRKESLMPPTAVNQGNVFNEPQAVYQYQ